MSGALLLLLPKCPACVAAYLAVWTGVSLVMPLAAHIRSALAAMFVISLGLLLARTILPRLRHKRRPHDLKI
ncbi:MAG TPA: hypothetical protein VER03_03705 [Bryobacteraceae bacterium]|nr:hypothetical protein [Bryobacteraceae bacterium]